jgi:hypothetical protein
MANQPKDFKPRESIMRLALHCRKCLQSRPANVSPKDYARQQVGLTSSGEIAVWCNRHDMLIGKVTIGGIVDPALLKAQCECCAGGKHHDTG